MSTPGKTANGFILPPVISTTERDALSAVNGMIVRNSTNGRIEFKRSSGWNYISKIISFMSQTAPVTLTNQTNAEIVILSGNGRIVWKGDLSNYRQCRFIIRVSVSSVSVNSPRVYLKYSTDNSTYSAISTVEQPCSLANTGFIDTGWFDMVTGACVNDVYVQPYCNGGNASADPAIDSMIMMFR